MTTFLSECRPSSRSLGAQCAVPARPCRREVGRVLQFGLAGPLELNVFEGCQFTLNEVGYAPSIACRLQRGEYLAEKHDFAVVTR